MKIAKGRMSNAEFWNVWARYIPAQGDLPVQSDMRKRVYDFLGFDAQDKVMDAGGGRAPWAMEVCSNFDVKEVIVVDSSPEMIRLGAKDLGFQPDEVSSRISLHEADITSLGFIPDESIDKIMSILVLGNLNAIDRIKALEEFYRVLTPGGKIAITTLKSGLGYIDFAKYLLINRRLKKEAGESFVPANYSKSDVSWARLIIGAFYYTIITGRKLKAGDWMPPEAEDLNKEFTFAGFRLIQPATSTYGDTAWFVGAEKGK